MRSPLSRRRGDTLITILVASGIAAMAIAATLAGLKNAFRGVASVEGRGAITEFKQVIQRRFSCRRTFPTNVCPGPNVIDPAPAGPPYIVRLKDDFGNDIFTPTTTGPAGFAVSQQFGTDTYVLTECIAGAVRVSYGVPSKPKPSGPIYGTTDMCQEVLGGVFNNGCGPGLVMVGINPDTLEPVCTLLANPCGAGQVVKNYNPDLTPNCVAVAQPGAHCPVGSYMVGMRADLTPECRALPAPPSMSVASCPGSFIKSYNPATGATTCGNQNDGAAFGGGWTMISGSGAGNNPSLPATTCHVSVPGPMAAFGCRCYTVNPVTNGCTCPTGFAPQVTNMLYADNAGLNLAGGFGCTAHPAGCGWFVGTCFKTYP